MLSPRSASLAGPCLAVSAFRYRADAAFAGGFCPTMRSVVAFAEYRMTVGL